MRTIRPTLTIALWLFAAGVVAAQQQNAPAPEPNQNTSPSATNFRQFDFGFRGTGFTENSDEARYQRYYDLRSGGFVDGFLWSKSNDHVFWDVQATHIGYRDQQYAANYNRFGKAKA